MGVFERARKSVKEYLAVLRVAKKPSLEDYKFMVKVCAIGLLLLGFLGFLIYIFSTLFIG